MTVPTPQFSAQFRAALEKQKIHPEVITHEAQMFETLSKDLPEDHARHFAQTSANNHIPEELNEDFTGVLVMVTKAEALALGISLDLIEKYTCTTRPPYQKQT
jgi:hypothetical protein